MKLDWDAAKARSNARKHGFHIAWAVEMFRGMFLAHPDIRADCDGSELG